MFSGITNIFFSRSSESDSAPSELSSEQTNPDVNLLTTCPIENSDWLIVDRSAFEGCEASGDLIEDLAEASEEPQEQQQQMQHQTANSTISTPAKSESSNTSGSEELSDFERFRGPFLSMQDVDPQSDTALSDVSSQPEHVNHPSLEECWIVTPPPCFTASESNAESVAMHPLENLLIEHPSMSVYWPRIQANPDSRRRPLRVSDEQTTGYLRPQVASGQQHETGSDASLQMGDDHVPSDLVEPDVFRSPLPVPANHPFHGTPRRARTGANRAENLQLLVREVPRLVEEQSARQRLKNQNNSRKFLKHQNRVREFASRGRNQHRKDRMGCPSGRNNDRKC